jgi:hypothetical protein
MRRATPEMREFATRLLVHEANGYRAAKIKIPEAFSVCDQLRAQLAPLMGNAGFRTLLSRALTLAGAEVPWLREAHLSEAGVLEGGELLRARLRPDEFFHGRVILLAHLFGLLNAFIGENLTLRLAREVWPQLPLHSPEFDQGAGRISGAPLSDSLPASVEREGRANNSVVRPFDKRGKK